MTWEVGQKWKNRVGKVFIIKRIDMNVPYPIYAVEYKSKNDTEWLYSLNGAFAIDGKAGASGLFQIRRGPGCSHRLFVQSGWDEYLYDPCHSVHRASFGH